MAVVVLLFSCVVGADIVRLGVDVSARGSFRFVSLHLFANTLSGELLLTFGIMVV